MLIKYFQQQNIQRKTTNTIPKSRSPKHCPEVNESRAWQRVSDIYYLLDTIKVSYESAIGKVTVEDISLLSLEQCIQSLEALALKESCATSKNQYPFVITVCGVTWENYRHKQSQQRVRAIPKAAGIRLFTDQPENTDAYFYQASQLQLDALPSDQFFDRQSDHAKAIGNLSLPQFITLLHQNNQQFLSKHKSKLYLPKQSFDALVTPHEQAILEQL